MKVANRVDGLIDVGIDTPVSILDIANAQPFTSAHGVSYRGLLDRSTTSVRDHVMYQTFRMNDGAKGEFTPVPERGIRTRAWLYVRQPTRRKLLFDQNRDPHELENLVQISTYDSLMDDFDKRINEHMKTTGDSWDITADFPPPDFLTHEAAADYLKNDLLPRAVHVP